MKYPGKFLLASSLLALASGTQAATYSLTIGGGDAIFLAGRTDLAIPPANQAWGDNNPATFDGMLRHGGPTPEEIQETLPPIIPVSEGSVVRVLDPAEGGISFFNGFGGTIYGPAGNGIPGSSSLTSFAGISGYLGTQGALTGVFLTDAIPNGGLSPATLDFTAGGLGIDFLSLSPEIGQIFYIGDGVTAGNVFQQFIAPTGATRLALGVVDGFGFNGVPGAYDDNDGQYRIRVGVDEIPVPEVPVPAALPLFLSGLAGFGAMVRRRRGA